MKEERRITDANRAAKLDLPELQFNSLFAADLHTDLASVFLTLSAASAVLHGRIS